ncbi:MAG: hypothetical protein LQ345_006987 [Seirophora villosa]|nr:MAG: hypothetical protein LQ345_006987 [Seirophora villosa]
MHEKLYSEGIASPQRTPSPPPARDATAGSHGTFKSAFSQSFSEAVAATLSTLSVDAQKRAAKDSQKKEAKAAAAEAKAAETKAQAQVLIKRVERNKRKYVTAVSGLEAHGMDLKKVAKEWGKKFATGSSVTKTASGGEEVVVQGDNSDEIFDWVVDVAGVPEANVDCIEDKKKKAT